MIFDWAMRLRQTPGFGWGFAIFSFAIALGLRFAVSHLLPPGFPFLTFFPAIMLTAFIGGTRPGILCAVLSVLAAWYWFIPPATSFGIDYQVVIALAFFVSIIVVDILIIHVMNRAVESARRERAQAELLADERRTLFQELQHRVANNLSFVASLLSLQKRKHKALPEVGEALDDARLRLDTLSRVHRRLYDPDSKDRSLREILGSLCSDIVEGSGRTNIACAVECDEIKLPLDRQMNLTLIVIELISNSLKHAFNGRDNGLIQVRVSEVDGREIEVVVADDGPGLPSDVETRSGDRLGNRIVQNLARTIGGTITQENDGGAVIRLRFPAL